MRRDIIRQRNNKTIDWHYGVIHFCYLSWWNFKHLLHWHLHQCKKVILKINVISWKCQKQKGLHPEINFLGTIMIMLKAWQCEILSKIKHTHTMANEIQMKVHPFMTFLFSNSSSNSWVQVVLKIQRKIQPWFFLLNENFWLVTSYCINFSSKKFQLPLTLINKYENLFLLKEIQPWLIFKLDIVFNMLFSQ